MTNTSILIDKFVRELSLIVRTAAIEAAEDALKRALSRPIRKSSSSAPQPSATKHQRRGQDDLQRLTLALLDYVSNHPGQGVQDIARGLGVFTNELVLPIRKLLERGEMTKRGERRQTTYFPRAPLVLAAE